MQKAILLVEDNPNDRELTRMAFEKCHISDRIDIVQDGAEALDYLFGRETYANRDLEEQPRLILLDLKLPKVSGLEVLKEIRNDDRTRYIPVVVLTSSRESCDLLDAYNLGANAYVRKPIDFNHFTEAIKQLGMFWLVFNEGATTTTINTAKK